MNEDDGKPKSGEGAGSSLMLVPKDTSTDGSPKLPLVSTNLSATADKGSVAVAGNNSAPIVNVQAGWGANVSVHVERQIARELPSHLSNMVARLSEDLSEYNTGPMRTLPPEVIVKVSYNNLPQGHHLLADYLRNCHLLEAAYRGIEQRNDDARRLVRRRAGVAYQAQLFAMCKQKGVAVSDAHEFALTNALELVIAVVGVLLADFSGGPVQVLQETAHLAICLIVADAVIECDVLERPADAVAS